jgi:hypothetical protein
MCPLGTHIFYLPALPALIQLKPEHLDMATLHGAAG